MAASPRPDDPAIVAPRPGPVGRPVGRRRRSSDRSRSSDRGRGRGRAATAAAVVALVTALLVGACGVGRSPDGPEGADAPSGDQAIDDLARAREEVFLAVTFDDIDRRLDDRVAAAGLPGGAYVVVPQGGERHLHTVGDVDLGTEVPLAESSMWTTTAVLLGLVDEGLLQLDEPIGAHLPWMVGDHGTITLRQLLSHTSGLPASVGCAEPTPAACDAAVAAAPLVDRPGEAFSVTDLDAHVAARLAEAVTATPWAELFADRLARPTGMVVTRYADPATTGGLLAVDGTTTADDLGRFLSMVRDGGRVGATEVLSPAAVEQMLLDQTTRLDTHTEPWVAETGVPTYGLGVWRDRLRGDDVASVVSAPNRYGLYPFVDAGRSAYGIVVVDDRTSPRAEAVSASALLSQLTAAVLRRPAD